MPDEYGLLPESLRKLVAEHRRLNALSVIDTHHVFGDDCLLGKRHKGHCRYPPVPVDVFFATRWPDLYEER